jgi:hypothetical protein
MEFMSTFLPLPCRVKTVQNPSRTYLFFGDAAPEQNIANGLRGLNRSGGRWLRSWIAKAYPWMGRDVDIEWGNIQEK